MKLIMLNPEPAVVPADAVLIVADVGNGWSASVVGTIDESGELSLAEPGTRLSFGESTPFNYLVRIGGKFYRARRGALTAYLAKSNQLDEYRRKESA